MQNKNIEMHLVSSIFKNHESKMTKGQVLRSIEVMQMIYHTAPDLVSDLERQTRAYRREIKKRKQMLM